MDRYLIKLNLARNCLRYIIKAYNIEQIYVPYYICPTVLTAIRKENCKIKFYHINENFYPAINFNENDFILYPNYFGICSKQVFDLTNKYKKVIVDNAHNLYMQDCGFASFNSLRKFLPLKDGAFLYISKKLDTTFDTDDYFYERFKILKYSDIVSNETRLNNADIKFISKTTEKYFDEIDLNEEKERRLNAFNILHERFRDKNELTINLREYDIPFIYPYLTRDDREAEILKEEGYLILRYWNFLPDNFEEYTFYRHLIPIPLSK